HRGRQARSPVPLGRAGSDRGTQWVHTSWRHRAGRTGARLVKLPKPIEELRSLSHLFDPKLLVRLRDAGAFDPRRAIGAVGTLPWLLGRGPSLGTLAQIHATAHGSTTALIDRSGELTWGELDGRANRLAHALESMDLRP